MQNNTNKVIFFDLYQSLLDVQLSAQNPNHEIQGWDAFTESLEKYGKKIGDIEIQKLYAKQRDNFYSERNKVLFHHNFLEIITQVLKNDLKLQLSKEEIISLIYEYRKASRGWLRLYPGVFDVLSRLSKEYILSTASHTQGCFTQIELQEMDIEQFFSHFIYTSDIGFRKESVEFYKRALEIVGKKPTDCLMIGDNYDVDVLVPQSLGIKVVWLKNPATSDRYAEYIKGQKPQNSIDLENIRELPDLIDSIV